VKHEAYLYHRIEDGTNVRCDLCHHRCEIASGKVGICRARRNEEGRLVSLVYGECVALTPDPIEKKPLFHFLPGTTSLSVATVGCNFRCDFCQNSHISQALRDQHSRVPGTQTEPREIVQAALAQECESVSFTYTEPTVFFEYALDTARLACEAGLANCFVSNGFMTPEAVEMIAPYLHAINVDLKSFRDETYRKVIGGRLDGVLETLGKLREKGIWVEVTTLLVPGMNDSPEEMRDIARFLARLDPDIPWHISRFFPHYKMTHTAPTPMQTIEAAVRIGEEEGIRFIYCGNVRDDRRESTWCRHCGALLIRRAGYTILQYEIGPDGACPSCGGICPGVWSNPFSSASPL